MNPWEWQLTRLQCPPLCKYYGLSKPYAQSAIEQLTIHSKIYFPAVKQFNDPLDCQLIPDFTGAYSDKFKFVTGMVHSTPSISNDIEERISKHLKFCAAPGGDERMMETICSTSCRASAQT